MIAFFVFLLAFLGFSVAFRALPAPGGGRPGKLREQGLLFVLVVLLVGGGGWAVDSLRRIEEPISVQTTAATTSATSVEATTPDGAMPPATAPLDSTRPTRRGFPADFWLFGLTGLVYGLSAIRGKSGQPAFIADVLVIGGSLGALVILGAMTRAYGETPVGNALFAQSSGEVVVSLFLMWAIARLTAALNRVPQATGGYLGVVAFLVLLLLHKAAAPLSYFPFAAGAALAGAGLATVPAALKRPTFNLGWSAALAMGFLLSQTVIIGLPDFTVQTALALAFLILALPLLDILFYRVRPRPEGGTPRLHEGLLRRGFSPTKVALLYTAVAVWLGTLGYQLSRLALGGGALQTVLRIFAIVLIGAGGFLMFFSVARVLMRRSEGEVIPEAVEAFGVKVSAVTMDEALAKIHGFIEERTPRHVVTCDANAILTAKADPEYADIVRRAALATPDGYGVIWGLRLLSYPIYERVTGVDMVTGICEFAAREGYSIYILGSEPGENGAPDVAAIAAQKLAERYPGLRVAGTHHGFWRADAKAEGISAAEADARMADIVRAAAPDVLFVAMGIPMQEKLIAAQLERFNAPVCLGVGGSFDVYSGKFNRAPQWVQRIGFEWLYRVFIDPSRWKRMGYVPRFMVLAIKVWLGGGKTKMA